MEPSKTEYRPEIDGLRAVAVLPVILFHAGFQSFSGGFVGVDVFFVISGYLITTIILRELQEGRFTIGGFYERRARRILPALFLVALVCIPVAWLVLYPRHFREFSESIVAVATFSSNVFFWKQHDYFGTAAELKPLLHTWSLAVEEQFYILFPLLLILLHKFLKRASLVVLVALLLSGFALGHWASTNKPLAAFFFLPTRGWELMVGAVIAAYLLKNEVTIRPGAREALGVGGVLMIMAAVLLYDDQTPFPGAYALLPTLGAGLVILFATEGTLAYRLLCTRPMVFIGLISYSAYLWHQPLLAFGRHATDNSPERIVPIAMVLLSLVLAYLSWKFVERPFRRKSPPAGRRRTLAFASVALAVLAGAGVVLATTGAQERWSLKQRLKYDDLQIAQHYAYMAQIGYNFDKARQDNGDCVFWSEHLGRTHERMRRCAEKYGPGVLYVGDSHMKNVHNVAYYASGNARFRVTIAKGACRFTTPACLYTELEGFLKKNPNLFGTLVYHQSGAHLLLDRLGRSDTQLLVKESSTVRIDIDEIEVITRGLNRLAGLVPKVLFLGPFYEPRVSFDNFEHLAHAYAPPAAADELFTRLDRHLASEYAEGAASIRFEYVSLMAMQPKSLRTLVHGSCFLYYDLDHMSLCGEKLLAEEIRRGSADLHAKLGL